MNKDLDKELKINICPETSEDMTTIKNSHKEIAERDVLILKRALFDACKEILELNGYAPEELSVRAKEVMDNYIEHEKASYLDGTFKPAPNY